MKLDTEGKELLRVVGSGSGKQSQLSLSLSHIHFSARDRIASTNRGCSHRNWILVSSSINLANGLSTSVNRGLSRAGPDADSKRFRPAGSLNLLQRLSVYTRM